MEAFVNTKIENGIATIAFFHPSGNSFPSLQLQLLTKAFKTIAHNKDVKAIILKSEGTTFCAGASFDELLQVSNIEEGKHFFAGFANVINAMRCCPQPILARVQGKAVGGGVGLIAACDYAIATDNAAIKLSELAIGIGPFVIEPAVSRKIGTTAFAHLSLAAQQWQSASWALQHGLYADLAPDATTLDGKIATMAQQWRSYNPDALIALKKTLWHGTAHWETLLYERAAISGTLVLSEFTKTTLAQFKKK